MDILNIGDDQYSSLLFLTVFGIVCIVWMFYLMKSKVSLTKEFAQALYRHAL